MTRFGRPDLSWPRLGRGLHSPNWSPDHTFSGPSRSVRAALFALRFYKAYLSILFAGTCRFEPTCSQYAYQAIERFGVLRGVWLGTKRLLRCHPFSGKFGYDPIPEKFSGDTIEIANHAAHHHPFVDRAAPIKDGNRL